LIATSMAAKSAPSRSVSPTGKDEGDCKTNPCLSFNYAYKMSRPGEIIDVAPGIYPDQEIAAIPSKAAGARITFRVDKGDIAKVRNLLVKAGNLRFEGMRARTWTAAPGSENLVFRNVSVKGGIFVTSAKRITMLGGSVGPGTDYNSEIKAADGSTVAPQDILIDGVSFHDWVRRNPAAHVDCLHVLAVDGLTIRNSRFRNCEADNIIFTRYGKAGWPRNVVIENNTFDCCRSGFYSVQIGGDRPAGGPYSNPLDPPYRNFLIRYNSTNKPFVVNKGVTDSTSNIRFESNIAPSVNPLLCKYPGVTWRYNLWESGSTCDPTEEIGPAGFADVAKLDFRLTRKSAAINSGNPQAFPARDISGRKRPQGGKPDAGAYER
jgi:hypothetical protein